jgi:putative ABC transport system substrate-binding protein
MPFGMKASPSELFVAAGRLGGQRWFTNPRKVLYHLYLKLVFSHNPKSKIQNPKSLLLPILAVLLVLTGSVALAQTSPKQHKIGYLTGASLSAVAFRTEAFRAGLRQLGYVEGNNVEIHWRSADGNPERGPALAAELVRLKVDVIVTDGSGSTRAAKKATSTIPIVMAQDSDPVGNGFVANLARPGGNITGLSRLGPELSGKRMELLKEIVPRLSRMAILGTSTSSGNDQMLQETELAAGAVRVTLRYFDVLGPEAFETAFPAAAKWRADAILFLVAGPVALPHRAKVAELAAKSRLPTMYTRAEVVEAGGLMSYGERITDLDRRAAVYVDKILKGAKPADMPVEQPKNLGMVINLAAAKQIGLTIPPNVLARADRVIK